MLPPASAPAPDPAPAPAPTRAPTLDQIIFSSPQANHNFSRILGSLKRASLSVTNRLWSIEQDAAFVEGVADVLTVGADRRWGGLDSAGSSGLGLGSNGELGDGEGEDDGGKLGLGLPLVANERCGSWYIDPKRKAGSAYFKSTDGHTGQWKFSLRRLNLHLLELIGERGGCIIVDSTRRGKRMPDALSKTLPIWCAVLNRALFPSSSVNHNLHTPPNVVSPSEAAQITALLPSFLTSFLSLSPDLDTLRAQLHNKPLRPVFLTPNNDGDLSGCDDSLAHVAETLSFANQEVGDDSGTFHPIICLTASRQLKSNNTDSIWDDDDAITEIGPSAGGYVQGAGDDTENWAHGLTADLFWRNKDRLLAARGEGEVVGVIEEIVKREEEGRVRRMGLEIRAAGGGEDDDEKGGGDLGRDTGEKVKEAVKGNERLFVGALGADIGSGVDEEKTTTCVVRLMPKITPREEWRKGKQCLEVGIGKGRAAGRILRDALPEICEFVLAYLRQTPDEAEAAAPSSAVDNDKKRVVVLCESGKDLSVGVVLTVYCWCFDDDGNIRPDDGKEVSFNKAAIRVRLSRIVTTRPEANPSRATLQSVNSFLMDWRK